MVNATSFGLLVVILLVLVLGVNAEQDYYKLLGVRRGQFTAHELKKNYRRLSRELHPDRNKSPDASEKFSQLSHAYETLLDDEKRRLYDQFGEEGLKRGGQGFQDPFDIFSRFSAGHGFRREEAGLRRGHDIQMDLMVTLEDLFVGKEIDVDLSKQVLCDKCRGSGANDDKDIKVCSTCGGHGIRVVRQQLAPGFVQQMQMTCDACQGKGKVIGRPCSRCKGKKTLRGNSQMSVIVEPGMPEKHRIVLDGESDQHPDYTPGDVTFTVVTQPHDTFRREADHLYTTIPISLREALFGFERSLKHLDGKNITLKRTSITQPDFVDTVQGEGMPVYQKHGERGNLFVTYSVILPISLSSNEQQVLSKLWPVPVKTETKEEL